MLRLQNNQVGIPTTVSGNTFTGHEWGVSLENYRNAVITGAGDIVVFERLFIAEGGQVIFEVTLNNPSSSDGALCRWTPEDGIEVLVHEGDASPGGMKRFVPSLSVMQAIFFIKIPERSGAIWGMEWSF